MHQLYSFQLYPELTNQGRGKSKHSSKVVKKSWKNWILKVHHLEAAQPLRFGYTRTTSTVRRLKSRLSVSATIYQTLPSWRARMFPNCQMPRAERYTWDRVWWKMDIPETTSVVLLTISIVIITAGLSIRLFSLIIPVVDVCQIKMKSSYDIWIWGSL